MFVDFLDNAIFTDPQKIKNSVFFSIYERIFYQQLLPFHETFSFALGITFAFRKLHYYIIACSVWHVMELA